MYGALLFDITGCDAFTGGTFAQGSRLRIRAGVGPDAGSALFAFTHTSRSAVWIGRVLVPSRW